MVSSEEVTFAPNKTESPFPGPALAFGAAFLYNIFHKDNDQKKTGARAIKRRSRSLIG